jgi:general secretion pathway protein D
VPLRFSVDPRTNSIVASGAPGDLNVVEAILVRLDEGDIRQRKTTVYRLKNAPAIDVANAINQFLTSERQVQQLAGQQTVSPFEQLEREVVVVPEAVSNSLIVSATPRFYDEIAKVVEELDARPPMVMIQVLIAEVALDDFEEFGAEFGFRTRCCSIAALLAAR